MGFHRARLAAIAGGAILVAVACLALLEPVERTTTGRPVASRRPVQVEIGAGAAMPDGFVTRELRADLRERRGIANVTPEFRKAVRGFEATQTPRPKRPAPKAIEGAAARVPSAPVPSAPVGGPVGEVAAFDSTSFDSNAEVSGAFAIPADPQAAAGSDHVMTVTNTTVVVHDKAGGRIASVGLAGFFGALGPLTRTFDPRVIYDHYNERWLVLTTERTDTVEGAAANTSRIFVAVSDDADPVGGWGVFAIDAVTTFVNPEIVGLSAHWADFPQIAVDEEAIYITANMFTFFSSGGVFGGVRLWIVDKGDGTGGFYDGITVSVDQYDPLPDPAFRVSGTPAMVFGTPLSSTFGTYIVNYSGISDGVNEALQFVRIDNPLGTPTFTPGLVELGDIQDTSLAPPFRSPQSGTAVDIVTNDSRALKAVWRSDNLWTTFTIRPPEGDPEFAHVAAHWVRVTLAGPPAVAEQGRVSGEDIAPGVDTFYSSLAVNSTLDVMIGFAASGSAIFPGAYYALHNATGAAGSVGPSQTLMAGVDSYVRKLGGPSNRWGDFSSVAVDPVDQCFWIFNNYAMEHGNVFDAGNGPESGQWGTRAAKFCATACSGVPGPVSNVRLEGASATLLTWDDLGEGFTYDLVIGWLSFLREERGVGPAGCVAPGLVAPTFLDDLPNPPAGEARYYILRARSTCAIGDYGTDSEGDLRVPIPGCPD